VVSLKADLTTARPQNDRTVCTSFEFLFDFINISFIHVTFYFSEIPFNLNLRLYEMHTASTFTRCHSMITLFGHSAMADCYRGAN